VPGGKRRTRWFYEGKKEKEKGKKKKKEKRKGKLTWESQTKVLPRESEATWSGGPMRDWLRPDKEALHESCP
jgi:hypothetical protein